MNKKNIIGFALIVGLILTAVVCAGCIFSEPDPIIGTFVYNNYTNQQSTSIDTSIKSDDDGDDVSTAKELQVGTIYNSNLILKFYENGTVLHCSIADKRVIHSYYTWYPIGNLTYAVIDEIATREYKLADNYDEITFVKRGDIVYNGPSFYRDDAFLIPPHYDTHIPHYDILYNNSEDQGKI